MSGINYIMNLIGFVMETNTDLREIMEWCLEIFFTHIFHH